MKSQVALGHSALHSSSETPPLTMVQAWRQESFWLEPCLMSLLQHSCSAAQMAWQSPKAFSASAAALDAALFEQNK